MTTLIVIDDERDIANFIRDIAIDAGLDASALYASPDLDESGLLSTDVLIIDLVMPEMDGSERLRMNYCQIRNFGLNSPSASLSRPLWLYAVARQGAV